MDTEGGVTDQGMELNPAKWMVGCDKRDRGQYNPCACFVYIILYYLLPMLLVIILSLERLSYIYLKPKYKPSSS